MGGDGTGRRGASVDADVCTVADELHARCAGGAGWFAGTAADPRRELALRGVDLHAGRFAIVECVNAGVALGAARLLQAERGYERAGGLPGPDYRYLYSYAITAEAHPSASGSPLAEAPWKLPPISAEEREPRYEVTWRARLRCREWRAAYRVATANVSRGGAFFVSPRLPPVGAGVEVLLELPDAAVLKLTGACVHVRTPEQSSAQGRAPGFGMRFDHAAQADLAKLEAMARAAGVPMEVRDQGATQPRPRAAPATTPQPDTPVVRLTPRPPRGSGR